MSFPVDSHHFGVKSSPLTMICEAPHGLAPICLPHLISYPLPYISATCFPFQPYVKVLFSNWAFVPFLFLIYFIPVSEINRLTVWVLMENESPCLASLIANGTGPNILHTLTYVIFNTESLVPCLRSPASKRQLNITQRLCLLPLTCTIPGKERMIPPPHFLKQPSSLCWHAALLPGHVPMAKLTMNRDMIWWRHVLDLPFPVLSPKKQILIKATKLIRNYRMRIQHALKIKVMLEAVEFTLTLHLAVVVGWGGGGREERDHQSGLHVISEEIRHNEHSKPTEMEAY